MRALVVAICLLAAVTWAADVPVAGGRLQLRRGRAVIELRDARLAPLPDPRRGLAVIVSGGAAAGQCHVEVALNPARWRPQGAGYRYRDPRGRAAGVRRALLEEGRLVIEAHGHPWPCRPRAPQRVPIGVVAQLGATRYCAAFDAASVRQNRRRRLVASASPPPAACPKTGLTVADLNILHGALCPPETAACRLDERIALLFSSLAMRGCPDVVTLQEISSQAAPLVLARLADSCAFTYEAAYQASNGIDDEMILSRYPLVGFTTEKLFHGFRTLAHARIDHPIGPLDVFSTHLASSSDAAEQPCARGCPSECVAAAAATVRECQAVQAAALVAAGHDVATPAVLTGDFNESPDSAVYRDIVGRGWVDTYRAVGNPECDPATGLGCTSGRADTDLSQLESPVSNEIERIDYIFLVRPGDGSLCRAHVDAGADLDGDGTGTRIFAGAPVPGCGPAPSPICWPSDHAGVELDLDCSM